MDYAAANGQPDARPRIFLLSVEPLEYLKDSLVMFRSDANAVVANGNDPIIPAPLRGNMNARRFRAAITGRFAGNEAAAWHYSVQVLTPLRPRIARLARGLLVHPRHLPYPVAAAIAGLPTTVTP